MRMLCFQFTVVHRSSNMVKEVDLLTRYNRFATHFRDENTNTPIHLVSTAVLRKYNGPIATTNVPLKFVRPPLAPKTEAAKRWASEITVVLGSAQLGETERAIELLGQTPIVAMAMEEEPTLNKIASNRLGLMVQTSTEEMLRHSTHIGEDHLSIDIYVATCHNKDESQTTTWLGDHFNAISSIAETTELKAAGIFFTAPSQHPPKAVKQYDAMVRYDGWKPTFWRLKNIKCGGVMATSHWVMILTTNEVHKNLGPP